MQTGSSDRRPTVDHQVRFHQTGARVIPLAEGPDRDLMCDIRRRCGLEKGRYFRAMLPNNGGFDIR